ncbi:GH25 family lysozyme [Sphingomonas sp.]|uniref:GH25 family lysozyme n=1 Tax=Sphingomonas sp. TaxID=28214 RepID=UPI001D497DC2|nr:GH25 family lysozyme [Sphingomonas sp.]MBX9796190.1 glycosyl hydrolase [Sphingomonas sp.]
MRRYYRRMLAFGLPVIALSLTAAAGWQGATSWRPSDTNYRFQGIDVGAEQGPIEWFTLRDQHVDFVYLIATRAATQRDPAFEAGWRGVYGAALRRGAIHVYSLCHLASDQGNNFNTTVPRTADALPPAILLDFQPDCAARPAREVVLGELEVLIAMIEGHSGKPVLLKTSAAFDRYYGVSEAIGRPIWSIGNFFPPSYAARPWRMWQASDMRRIEGAAQPVRWNVVAP